MNYRLFQVFRRLLASENGMLFVLLLLIVVFSAATTKTWMPQGGAAADDVAAQIEGSSAPGNAVIIVFGRDLLQDGKLNPAAVEFEQTLLARMQAADIRMLDTIIGEPRDARQAMQAHITEGRSIRAVATTGAAAGWTIYDRIEGLGSERLFVPEPYLWPVFLQFDNLRNVAWQTAVFAIIAIGMTMVIIAAGIDLSVGSLVALGSVATALVVRRYGAGEETGPGVIVLASICGVSLCTLAGAFSGTVSTVFRIPAFIVTLSMMRIASGFAFRLSEGQSISHMPAGLNKLGLGTIAGIPNPVIMMIVLYAIAHVVMTRTVFGRYVYAVGGNQEAARLSGVPVRKVLITVYAVSGALAGLGGLILTGQLDAGDPKLGKMYELEVITAVVVGGASLMGGEGRVLGTLIGALIIAVIKNGMNQMRIDSFDQEIVLGTVLLATVLLDTLRHRKGFGLATEKHK